MKLASGFRSLILIVLVTFLLLGIGAYLYAGQNTVYSPAIVSSSTPTPQTTAKNTSLDSSELAITSLYDHSGRVTPYTKKGTKIYFNGQEVVGPDLQTFQVINHETIREGIDIPDTIDYAISKNKVFSSGQLLKEADAATFKILKTTSGKYSEYAEDKNNVYDYTQILEADHNTFQAVSQSAAKDKNTAYWGSLKLSIVSDPSTFIYFGTYYFKDSQHVYYVTPDANENIVILQGADPHSFTALSYDETTKCNSSHCVYDGQDKYHRYFYGKIAQ
jgi:hypothetical protein